MADERLWEVDRGKTEGHWLELNSPDGRWHAVAKWDGCIDLDKYTNHSPKDREYDESADRRYMHICNLDDFIARLQAGTLQALWVVVRICNLDDFIARLQALRREAIDHFTRTQGEWPG